ncbi:hypothetical protein B0H10DRAFT_1937906 [Mycena sp. CBHHK59/15]|nr:hypothetical protein B0H10DRAFT_1937906 [Mycena sp. CBHHK59/15]
MGQPLMLLIRLLLQFPSVAKPVLALIKKLTTLSKALPDSVPKATEEDDIRRIMTEVTGDDPQQTFVRRFNIVFGMQTRDSEGHLTRIRRGALGMDCVLEYLNSIPWISTTIELSVVEPKLSQLIEEMERLCSPSPAAKPKAKKAPSGKETTDKSGKAQPKSKSKKADLPSNHRSGSGDESDTAYKPRKARCVSEEEEDDFEGEDASDDDAEPKTKKRKRVIIDGDETTLRQKAGKRAKKGTKKSTSSAPSGPTIDLTEIDDDNVDEGNTNGKKGPKNTSRVHFHDPVVVKHQGERRWEFKCRHCSSITTVKRTVPHTAKFEEECPQPLIGNLATHLSKKHTADELRTIPEVPTPGVTRGTSSPSAKIMQGFIDEGKINPAHRPTQGGFNKVFAAWLIEDNLAWTTGETDGTGLVPLSASF